MNPNSIDDSSCNTDWIAYNSAEEAYRAGHRRLSRLSVPGS
jgi:hypothetical protein